MLTSRRVIGPRLAALSAAVLALGAPVHASPLLPSFMSVDVPVGTQGGVTPGTGIALDPSTPLTFTDDVFLNTLTFGSTSFSGASFFAAAVQLEVTLNRGQVNIEWGDDDGPGDGDDNPLAKAGEDPADKESTDPSIQDPGLLRAFDTLSLTEMTDGEGGDPYGFKVLFSQGVLDNDDAAD